MISQYGLDNLGHSVINPVLESQKMVKEHNAQATDLEKEWPKNLKNLLDY